MTEEQNPQSAAAYQAAVERSEMNAPAPPARRQPGQLIEIWLQEPGQPEPALHTLRVLNPDRIAYEMTANKHPEWPALAGGKNFAMTFVTFAAAKRTGLTSITFEQWQKALLDYDAVGDEPSDPTR